MTIATAPVPLKYNGDGTTTAFPVTWPYFAKSHVRATLRSAAGVETLWVEGTNYTLTAPGASGTLTATVAPATGETLLIDPNIPNTQDAALPLGGAFPSDTVEDELDKAVLRDAKIEALFDRSLRVPKTDTQTGSLLDLPIDSSRASKFLGFDSVGKPIAAAGTSADLTPVSTFINGLLDDVDGETLIESIRDDLTALTTPALGDEVSLYDASAVAPRGRRVSLSDILALLDVPSMIFNVGLTASVAANALTIALKTKALGDATTANPVKIAFRNATLTTGDYVVRSVTAALSIVVPQGATLGFTSSETGFIYIYTLDNAGTVELAVAKKALFDESTRHSTTILDTSSDSDSVLYSTTARTNVAVKLLGRLKIQTGVTAGDWSAEDTVLTLWTPTMKKTGDIVQVVHKSDGALASGATTIPLDDTIPQNTEGNEFITQAITPKDAQNKLVIEHQGYYGENAGGTATAIVALFQDAVADALAATSDIAGANVTITLKHEMSSGTTSSTTFKIRAGLASGTINFNGFSAARRFGGVANSFLRITEIQT